jgi:hypothetical protein
VLADQRWLPRLYCGLSILGDGLYIGGRDNEEGMDDESSDIMFLYYVAGHKRGPEDIA